jgi:hypothetical protein
MLVAIRSSNTITMGDLKSAGTDENKEWFARKCAFRQKNGSNGARLGIMFVQSNDTG